VARDARIAGTQRLVKTGLRFRNSPISSDSSAVPSAQTRSWFWTHCGNGAIGKNTCPTFISGK
jgi:hypothetical protein